MLKARKPGKFFGLFREFLDLLPGLWRNRLAARMIFFTVAVSTLFSIFATFAQLYSTYQRGLSKAENGFLTVEKSFIPSLSHAVWTYDFDQIETILEAVKSTPDVVWVRLDTPTGEQIEFGARAPGQNLAQKSIPIFHKNSNGLLLETGKLHVALTYGNLISELTSLFWVILATNFVKSILVSFSILLIFYFLISRHLREISRFVRTTEIKSPLPQLTLNRLSGGPDDLEEIVDALNQSYREQLTARGQIEQVNRRLTQTNLVLNDTVGDLKKTEAELRQNQEILRDTQTVAQIASWEFDENNLTHKWHTDELYNIFGVENTGHCISEDVILSLVHPDDLAGYQEVFDDTARIPRTYSHTYRIIKPNGETATLRDTAAPIFDSEANHVGYRGMTQDVTQQAAAEEQLRQSQKMEVVGQLTGGVAHDFNNLLAIVQGNLEFAVQDLKDGDPLKNLLEPSIRACVRGATLSHRLLAFSRKQTLRPVSVNGTKMVDGMLVLIRQSLGASIDLEVNFPPKLWPCLVDPGQLESAILNLVINARDAMSDGGILRISAENTVIDHTPSEGQSDLRPGHYVVFSVADTGPGMTNDIIEQAFEPFFTTKRVGAGSGLGLSMVYGFAKQSGGHATIESSPGQGTKVNLYLPRFIGATSAGETDLDMPIEGAKGETILVVEDNEDLRHLVVKMLGSLGYKIIQADNGREALEKVQQVPGEDVNLLLTDIVLPGGMNGLDLANAMTRLNDNMEVLYMSGYSDKVTKPEEPVRREENLLQKPFRKERLARAVRDCLDKKAG